LIYFIFLIPKKIEKEGKGKNRKERMKKGTKRNLLQLNKVTVDGYV